MLRNHVFYVMGAFLLISASPKSISPEDFFTIADGSRASCSLEADHDRLFKTSKLQACIETEEAQTAKIFRLTLSGMRTKEGRSAVRKFYATWLTSMNDLRVQAGEGSTEYDARQRIIEHELQQLGNEMKAAE